MKQFSLFFTVVFILFSNSSYAQISKDSDLFIQLKKADSLFFEEGFNKCNFEILEAYIPKDFEFYHDENGIQNREQFFTAFRESICSNTIRKPIRKVVEGSLEVFRLKNNGETYGAIQKGTHLFYIKEPNKEPYLTNIAKFTSIWNLENDKWKLSRVLSYDHHQPKADYGSKFESNFPEPLFTTDADIEKMLAQNNIPSVGIGYINNGELQQIRVFGEKRKGNPVDYNTVYKVASLTKPITALIALKLVEKGLWDLDEPVCKYHIEKDVKRTAELKILTTRHILSHRSGFPNWRHLTESQKLTFEFKPGTKFQYSGEGYEYLRKALEAKFKKGLEELADELLFKPLKMNNTHFFWNENINEKDYALEHDENGEPIAFEKYYDANAAANLLTTVQDYGNFMAHIINGAGLSESLYNEFLTPYSNKKPGIDWGLGCQLLFDLDEEGEFAVMHGGGDYGLKTIMLMLPKSKKGLLIFSNSENGMVLWRKLIEEYFGELGEEIVKRQLN